MLYLEDDRPIQRPPLGCSGCKMVGFQPSKEAPVAYEVWTSEGHSVCGATNGRRAEAQKMLYAGTLFVGGMLPSGSTCLRRGLSPDEKKLAEQKLLDVTMNRLMNTNQTCINPEETLPLHCPLRAQ